MKCQLFLLAVSLGCALGQVQVARLYSEYNGDGDYVLIPETYEENLARLNFDNRAHSVCVTGIWLLYQDTNFNAYGGRGMEYIFGRDNYCVNIRTIAGTVSSIRYAGAPKDYTRNSLSLFEFDYFQGREEYVTERVPNLNLAGAHESIIITGNAHWQVYDLPNYTGNTVCLRVPEPGTSTPSFLADTANNEIPIPHGTIRSIHRDCNINAKNVTLTSFARMQKSFEATKLE